jgi:hypothetical protein
MQIRLGAALAGVLLLLAMDSNQAWPQTAGPTQPAGSIPSAEIRPNSEGGLPNTPDSPAALASQYGPGEGIQLPSLDIMRLGVGPHEYSDYAPQGFYPNDYQEAPGLPLYEPIIGPVPVTAEERQRFVTRGMVPGSIQAPGTNTSFRFSGFVRLGETFDFNPIGTRDSFVTNSIPVPQETGQNMNFSARPTRLSLDTWTPTAVNDWNVHTFFQFDFFSGNPPGVGSSSNPRLRFAYADFGYFRVGQDTTVFMDPSSFPRTADFNGPSGLVNMRQGLVRATLPLGEKLFWAMSAEQPFSAITTLGNGDTGFQDVPDFATHLRYESDLGHLQVSSIVRTLGYQPAVGEDTRKAGWGMNFTTNFHPWAILMHTDPIREADPTGLERSRILLQYAFGWGINRYIQDTSGLGMDGAVDAAGTFNTLYGSGWTASYEHWLNKHWLSNFTYSRVLSANTPDGRAGGGYIGADYVAASLWWIPITRMSIGAEYLYGTRENFDSQFGTARRIQTVFQYNF